jgi:hypothetical protein
MGQSQIQNGGPLISKKGRYSYVDLNQCCGGSTRHKAWTRRKRPSSFFPTINSDPGHDLIGKVEKAHPIEGEPASEHYYLIGGTYFDGNSAIGQKILKVCKVGQLCAVKVGVEKSWEHNVDHATFWITKIVGGPIGDE